MIYIVQDGSNLHKGHAVKFTRSTKTIRECLLYRLFKSIGEIPGNAYVLIFSNNKEIENRNANSRCFQQSTCPAISCRMGDANRHKLTGNSHVTFKKVQ